jgi:hypothetical protein
VSSIEILVCGCGATRLSYGPLIEAPTIPLEAVDTAEEVAHGTLLRMDKRISVLCVDDHQIVREGIVAVIGRQIDMEVTGTARERIAGGGSVSTESA